jgi:hypothetical protein
LALSGGSLAGKSLLCHVKRIRTCLCSCIWEECSFRSCKRGHLRRPWWAFRSRSGCFRDWKLWCVHQKSQRGGRNSWKTVPRRWWSWFFAKK